MLIEIIAAMTGPPLKDQLFNLDGVTIFAGRIAAVCPSFPGTTFFDEVVGRLGELELKQRIAWITDVLELHLPED